MSPSPSYIFKYFNIIENKAQCKHCDKTYSKNSRNLKNHLEKCHHSVYLLYKNANNEALPKNKQDVVEAKPPTTNKINKLIMEYLLFENLPFEHIEGQGFRRLLKGLAPKYNLPDAEYLKKCVDDLYKNIFDKVKEEIEKNLHISLTAYIEKDPNSSNKILIISSHGLSKTFERSSMILECIIIDDSATGDIVEKTLNKVITKLNISTKQVHCIVRDESSSLQRVTEPMLPIQELDCTVHKIQTILRETFLSEENITDLRQNFEKIAESNIQSVLQEIKEALNLNATDWDSTYKKFKTLFSTGANFAIKTGNLCSNSQKEWEESRNDVLKCIDYINDLYDSQTLLSSVLPIFKMVTESLTKYLNLLPQTNVFQAAVSSLKKKFETTLSSLEKNHLYLVATFLDPRYLSFFKEEMSVKICDLIMATNDDAIKKGTKRKMADSSDSDKATSSKISDRPIKTVLLNEITKYELMKDLDLNDPLEWWKENCDEFKTLAICARKYLSTPAATVVDKQLFGGDGNWELPLKPKLIFIKHNIDTFEFNY